MKIPKCKGLPGVSVDLDYDARPIALLRRPDFLTIRQAKILADWLVRALKYIESAKRKKRKRKKKKVQIRKGVR